MEVGTNGYLRQNSGCSAEHKTPEIPFRTLRRKFRSEPFGGNSVPNPSAEIPFRGPKIEANSRNSLPNPSAEEKTAGYSIAWNKNRSKLSEFTSEPFSRKENNSEFQSVEQKKKQTLGILF
jgi:hypothetical protein